MLIISLLKLLQTLLKSLQSFLKKTFFTVRLNVSVVVEMTFASNNQDSNAEARAKFNVQFTQNIQFIISSSEQKEL